MAKKQNDGFDNETDEILFNLSMGLYGGKEEPQSPEVNEEASTNPMNERTGWDDETPKEKQARYNSQPGHWNV